MAKTALVTGCSSGFGRHAALEFRARGWNVVATMRDPGSWAAAPTESGLMLAALDVRSEVSIDAAFAAALSRFGRLDAIVNNAGMGLFSVFETTPHGKIRDVFETNFFGPLTIMQKAIPHMRDSGGGVIVNVASGSAVAADPLMAVYSASKAAIASFSEALEDEVRDAGIAVKVVIPGFVAGTNFVSQTQRAAEQLEIPAAYKGYVQTRMDSYLSTSSAAFASEQDVACAIVDAAECPEGKQRWLVGADIAEAAAMRWETSDAKYSAWRDTRYHAPKEAK